MGRQLWVCGLCLATAAGSFFGVKHLRSQVILSAEKQAFTVQLVERSLSVATGNVRERQGFYAQRRDGSTAEGWVVHLKNGSSTTSKTVRLLPDRKRVFLHELTGSMSTELLSADTVLQIKSRPLDATCRTHPDLVQDYEVTGNGEFLGFDVVKLKGGEPGFQMEVWEAQELGCYPLYSRIVTSFEDGRPRTVAERAARSVSGGCPACS